MSTKSMNSVEYLELLPVLDNPSKNVYEKIYYETAAERQARHKQQEENEQKKHCSKLCLNSTWTILKIIFLVLVIVAVTLLCLTLLSNLVGNNKKNKVAFFEEKIFNLPEISDTEPKFQFELSPNMTNRIVTKLSNALLNHNSPYGRQIRLKSTGECFESSLYIWQEVYLVIPATCEPTSPTQHFRMSKSEIQVATQEYFPKMDLHKSPCLDIHDGRADGEILVCTCHGNGEQQFRLQVYPRQTDFTNQRIHFSLMSVKHPARCITLRHLEGLKVNAFKLAQCSGSSLQSFYLSDVNFVQEIEQIRNKKQN